MPLIHHLFFVSLLSVAIHILAIKWGLVDWYNYNRQRWMPAACNFCLYFWLGLMQLAVLNFTTYLGLVWPPTAIFYALCTAVLSLVLKSKIGHGYNRD